MIRQRNFTGKYHRAVQPDCGQCCLPEVDQYTESVAAAAVQLHHDFPPADIAARYRISFPQEAFTQHFPGDFGDCRRCETEEFRHALARHTALLMEEAKCRPSVIPFYTHHVVAFQKHTNLPPSFIGSPA